VNDRVLVSQTARPEANGVYSVAQLGGTGTGARWSLVRAADSDTEAELRSNSVVRVSEGTGIGFYRLTYTSSATLPFARCPIEVAQEALTTNIGSNDPSDAVTFVVSTAAGTNTAAGSLGKMMLLRQQNDTSATENKSQQMDFRFSGQIVTPIQLTQQLPSITKAFTIDGNSSYNPPGSPAVNRPRITVDGSRIVQNSAGNTVLPDTPVHGFDIRSPGASGTILSNMTVAGFTKGAAVRVRNTDTVLLNGLSLGTSELGLRVANEFGVLVSGSASEVTVLNSTITASTKAGLRAEEQAKHVVLVGNNIGLSERDNNIGVQFDSVGPNRIGVEPIGPLAAIPAVAATRTGTNSFTLPASFRASAAALTAGLGVTGTGIAPNGGPVAVINNVVVNPTTGVATVTIQGGTVAASGSVTFGNFATTTLGATTLTLPASINPDSLYLGQAIAGNGIVPGSRITRITRNGLTSVTLSSPMTISGVARITFPGANNGAPRNTIQNNLVGVELRSGDGSIVNTSIINNALDGVRISGGTHVIGRPDGTRSSFSNVIHGNGGFGIVVDAGSGNRAAAVALAGRQVIRGNFLGVTVSNQAARLNTKGNIGIRHSTSTEEVYPGESPDFKFRPLATTFIDGEGNQHHVTSAGRTGSGSSPRRDVPPVPPRRR
jgi:hypothetical protein